jgi:hypothetical protein
MAARYIPRTLEPVLRRAAREFPANDDPRETLPESTHHWLRTIPGAPLHPAFLADQ